MKRKGCGAHVETGKELLRAALRFARVSQKKRKGCGAHVETGKELLRAALRFARVSQKKTIAVTLAASTLLLASGADGPKVPRAKIAEMEKQMSAEIASMYPDEPYFLIGLPRGAYLDGVGVVFSAEINLATGPAAALRPFRQGITKEEIQKHREKKETRLPALRNRMMTLLGSMAASLEAVPNNEELVLVVTLLRYPWEDASGVPSQLIMRSSRAKLMGALRANAKLDSAIRMQEY